MIPVLVRGVCAADLDGISRICNHYIGHTVATFEEAPVAAATLAARIGEIRAAGLPWLTAEREGRIAGYAYASKWKGRCAYRHSVESTVYVDPGATAQGIGSRLYEALLEELRERGIHTVIGGIALPNPASVALHERLGFEQIARFREVGFKFGRWIDVGYWQLVLGDGGPRSRPRPAS